MSDQTYTIDGRTLTMPVQVRRARNWIASFPVPLGPVERLVEHTGLEAARVRPGKAMVTLGFVEYEDTDLGAYHEFMVSIMVRKHGRAWAESQSVHNREFRRNDLGVYIHRLPVDDRFSMDAGRGIWGYPKTLMEFARSDDGRSTAWTLSENGAMAVQLRWKPRWIPMRSTKSPPTYTFLDGVLRMTTWQSRNQGVRFRPRGAQLTLGQGELAEELRSLGLGRPILSISVTKMQARFGPAQVIDRTSASSEEESGEPAKNL